MKKAFTIIRVSAEDQLRGYGPDNQWFDDVLPNAPFLGLEVSETYRCIIQERATSWDREKYEASFREALELYGQGVIQALLFPRVDRETRFIFGSVTLLTEALRAGLQVYFAREKLFLDLNDPETVGRYLNKAIQAQAYVQIMVTNTTNGKRRRVRTGKIVCGKGSHLFGFKYIRGREDGQGVCELNEDQASWIRQWKNWLLEDSLSLNEITFRMRDSKVPTPSGKSIWRTSTIHGILRNPAIMGKTYALTYDYNEITTPDGKKKRRLVRKPKEQWVEIPGATPAIITEADFRAIQEKLNRNREFASRKAKLSYILRGHVFCAVCGRRYRGKALNKKRKDGTVLRYYQCPSTDRAISPAGCPNRRLNADQWERLVCDQLVEVLSKPDVILHSLKTIQDGSTGQLEHYQIEIRRVDTLLAEIENNQRDLLYQSIRGFPESLVTTENKKLNDERARLMQWKNELIVKIQQVEQATAQMAEIKQFCELARINLFSFTTVDWQIALEALSIRVVVNHGQVNIEGAIPLVEKDAFVSDKSPFCWWVIFV